MVAVQIRRFWVLSLVLDALMTCSCRCGYELLDRKR